MSRIVLATVLALSLAGCGVRKRPPEEAPPCRVYDVQVEVNDRRMTITWKKDCPRLISGYNVYVSREPLAEKYPGAFLPASVVPFNHPPFPGDTDPEDEIEHFEAERLENGVRYYVSVRVVFPDQTLSKPSNEVVAVCGPRGEMELSIRYKSGDDGFSFEENKYVAADDLKNDLYFLSKGGTDYLGSPSRLGGFLRENKFQVLPFTGDFQQLRGQLPRLIGTPTADLVEIHRGDWVLVVTPEARHALLQVRGFTGRGEARRVRLFYAYSPLAGEPVF